MKRLVVPAILGGLVAISFGATIIGYQPEAGVGQTPATIEAEKSAGPAPINAASSGVPIQPTGGVGLDNAAAKALLFGTELGGSFDLIDHFGQPKQLEDYAGKFVMLFFGYANCEAICSTALPLMADTVTLIGKETDLADLTPIMITVDPENDTPEYMRKRLGQYHPSLIGMTGSDAALADVRSKFQVNSEEVARDIAGKPVFNHGSFVYLMGPDGKMRTFMPPILEPVQMADIVKKYMLEEIGKS